MTANHTYNDETLVAYLDNELPTTERDAIDRSLEISPALAVRLQKLDVDRALVKQAFDAAMLKAPDAPDMLTQIPVTARRGAVLAIAGLAAVCGVLAGLWLGAPEPLSWQQQAIMHSMGRKPWLP